MELTPRQEKILESLVRLFIETGEDVSSFDLMKVERFPFSSATLRNEFLFLTKEGYLVKSHFASGRFPTEKGLRYYVSHLMEEEEIDFYKLVELSHKLFNNRFNIQNLLRLAMKELYAIVGNPVFVVYNSVVQNYRLSQILREFKKIQSNMRPKYLAGFAKLLDILEDGELVHKILTREFKENLRGIGMFTGKKLGWDSLESFVIIYAPFKLFTSDETVGYIGVLGYLSLNYPVAIPAVRSFSEMLSNLLRGW